MKPSSPLISPKEVVAVIGPLVVAGGVAGLMTYTSSGGETPVMYFLTIMVSFMLVRLGIMNFSPKRKIIVSAVIAVVGIALDTTLLRGGIEPMVMGVLIVLMMGISSYRR